MRSQFSLVLTRGEKTKDRREIKCDQAFGSPHRGEKRPRGGVGAGGGKHLIFRATRGARIEPGACSGMGGRGRRKGRLEKGVEKARRMFETRSTSGKRDLEGRE